MATPTPRPPARDPGTRVLRWAAAAALAGALLLYHSFASSGSDVAVGAPTPGTGFRLPAAPMVTLLKHSGTGSAAQSGPTRAPGPSLPASPPTRLVIRSIGVNAPFTPLSTNAAGVLQPPPETNNNLAGWYQGGVTPGELGNAIVAGHVDTKTGPAVFFLLSFLRKGDPVDVTRSDGTVATFKVDSVHTFSKGSFPDQLVYGATPDAEMRLITCGGSYDRKKKDYESNVVVFAHLASTKKA